MPFTYEYPRPAVAVDAVVFGFDENGLSVLLIERALAPFAGKWALPGGFVRMDEDLDAAVRRELQEETGLEKVFLEQLGAYGTPGRDPRERVVTVAWVGLVKLLDHRVRAATDARRAAWFATDELPALAFDHDTIVADALAHLQQTVRRKPVGFELLPPKFTLTQLQKLYEAVLERPLDKRNFRKKVLALDLLEGLEEVEQDVAHRAAQLYRFDMARYRTLAKQGFAFEI